MIVAAPILACLAVTGICVAAVAARPRSALEGVAYSLLFGLCVIPFAALVVALVAGLRISLPLLAGVSAVVSTAAVAAWWRSREQVRRWRCGRSDALVLAAAGLVAVAAALHYSDEEALLSLASYALNGEAKCFYHLSFQLVEALNPGASFDLGADLYDIISTPGNALFTAPLLPLLGLHAFRVVYALIWVLAFLFVALGVRRWGGGTLASVAAGLVAVASPFAVSIEVLDRNAIAFALSAALLYSLETRPGRPVLHGWLFGIVAGTGLRFLPLLNVFLVVGAAGVAHLRRCGLGRLRAQPAAPLLPRLPQPGGKHGRLVARRVGL